MSLNYCLKVAFIFNLRFILLWNVNNHHFLKFIFNVQIVLFQILKFLQELFFL